MPLRPIYPVLCHFSAPVQDNKKDLLYPHSWELCQGGPCHLFRLPFCLCGSKHLKTFRPDFTVRVVLLSWCKVDGFQPKLASGHSLPLVPVKAAGKGQHGSHPRGPSAVSHARQPGPRPRHPWRGAPRWAKPCVCLCWACCLFWGCPPLEWSFGFLDWKTGELKQLKGLSGG